MKRLLIPVLAAIMLYAVACFVRYYTLPPEVQAQTNTFCAANLTCTVSAAWTYTSSLTASNANGALHVCPTCANTTIGAAYTALPSAGGTIFVDNNAVPDTATISIGATKPVHIIFDYINYTYSQASAFLACTGGTEGVRISGQARNGTGNSTGSLIGISNASGIGINFTNCPGALIDNITFSGAGSASGATNKGLVLSGHDIATQNVLVTSFGGDGVTFDGTSVNTNDCKFWNSRSQNNGGVGVRITGVNANDCLLANSSAGGNTGDGFFVTGTAQFEVFWATDTAQNASGIGYHLNSPNNFLVAFSDAPNAPETAAIQFDAAALNNEVHCLKNAMPINTDNGSGNRYYGCGGTFGAGGSTWNVSNSQVFRSNDGSVGAPAFDFSSETNTGWYRAAAGDVRLSVLGADHFRLLSTNGPILTALDTLAWGSSGVGSPDTGLSRDAAGVLDIGNGTQGNKTGRINIGAIGMPNLLASSTAPTIAAAGCGGGAAAIASNNGTAAFKINVGTTPGSACTITMPTATTGWNCYATDITTNSTSVFLQKQTGAESQTSVTITNFSDVAVATAFTASDILKVACTAD